MNTKTLTLLAVLAAVPSGAQAATPVRQDAMKPAMAQATLQRTTAFKGAEVNGGFATLLGRTLRLSPDFKIPKAPAPTWQIVDKEGNVYLLKQLNIVGGKTNRSVEIPAYVKNVAKVRVYCTFAEVSLGEASFAGTIELP